MELQAAFFMPSIAVGRACCCVDGHRSSEGDKLMVPPTVVHRIGYTSVQLYLAATATTHDEDLCPAAGWGRHNDGPPHCLFTALMKSAATIASDSKTIWAILDVSRRSEHPTSKQNAANTSEVLEVLGNSGRTVFVSMAPE
jgi:hypothetical protein